MFSHKSGLCLQDIPPNKRNLDKKNTVPQKHFQPGKSSFSGYFVIINLSGKWVQLRKEMIYIINGPHYSQEIFEPIRNACRTMLTAALLKRKKSWMSFTIPLTCQYRNIPEQSRLKRKKKMTDFTVVTQKRKILKLLRS